MKRQQFSLKALAICIAAVAASLAAAMAGHFIAGCADNGTAIVTRELRMPGFRWSPWLIGRAVLNRILAGSALFSPTIACGVSIVVRRWYAAAPPWIYFGVACLSLSVLSSREYYREPFVALAVTFLVWFPQVLTVIVLEWFAWTMSRASTTISTSSDLRPAAAFEPRRDDLTT